LFRELLAAGAGEIAIQGVGVTGSGRYLVGSFIGADLIKNEITAQTRAAADIDPDADIIEIGGQDSKLVLKRNGVVIDYQMNKACAAGTGSFIDELAELLGVSVKDGQFARLAFAAPQTIDLGTRCAAFMAQAVATAQQEGQSLEVITSSLAVAIARNYLSKVVGTRKLGPKVILTGAVFYNDAVAAAFRAQLPGKTLVVAEHREVSGAIGAALLAREARLAGSAATPGGPGASAHPSGTPAGPGPCDPAGLPQGTCRGTSFKGFAATVAAEPRLSTFTCRACANNCTITRMQMPGSPTTFYGSRCDRYDARFDGDGTGRRMATGGAEDDGEKGDGHVSTPGGTAPARGAPSSRPRATFFDERERLLFRELQPLSGLSTQRAAGLQARPGPQAAPHAPGAEPGAGRAPTRGAELRGASGPGPLAAPAADPRSEGKGAGGAGSASGPTVAIPRALLVYDYAPLLAGFLDALGARAVFSERTDQQVLEQAVELSYTDSCFPLKLLHGHVARLREADFILYPSLLRLAPREGDENQHYACPLVQASPYIVRTALDLGARLIVPALDLSRGPEPVVRSLAGAARQMGYSRRAGLRAARAGLAAQERFSADLAALGRQRLAELEARSHAGGQEGGLGVVLFARSYMAQDAGANLGIAEKLARLGVVPVPLDFLPLSTVDPRRYSDRPYWHYESRQIAAAALTAAAPHLYGLVLTNFGCGPNSFVLRLIEDIMGAKPLGQMEIDEHAAEAGLVTRLEAFVDTIRAHAKQAAGRAHALHAGSTTNTTPGEGSASSEAFRHYRGATPTVSTGKTLLLPRMAPHADVLRAAFEACGVRALVLPEPDERNLLYANQVTSGVECLPYRVSLGDFIRAHHEMNGEMAHAEGFMAGSYGPCRLGKYAIEQMRILKDLGIDLTIHSTVSNSAYRDLGLGPGFERLAWRGIVAMDSLQKLLWRARPYERQPGAADAAFEAYTARLAERVLHKEAFAGLLRQATAEFRSLIDPALPRRPRVGINGEIFLRANCFANSDLVRVCERAGLEVVVSPLGEWFKYTAFRNVEDAYHDRRIGKTAVSYIRQLVQERDERAIEGLLASGEARPTSRTWGPRDRKPSAEEMAGEREPSTAELLACSSRWLSPTCGSEAVLSLGSGVAWMESPHFAGVISVMPHGCMPGGIVAAMSEKLSAQYGKPWINLTYDGFMETNNLARINNFAEVLRFSQTGA
jgi:predicted nucleotide-binding protein (sugar kinase/HSP70/actin superfamily)